MLLEAALVGIILLGYVSAYLVSLYSAAVNLDPEEIDKQSPNVSHTFDRFLIRLAGNPRAFLQIAAIYRSFVMIAITVAATLLLKTWAVRVPGPEKYLIYAGGLIGIWGLSIFFLELLPRRMSRRALSRISGRHLWVISIIYFLFLPVVKLYGTAMKRSAADDVVTEEEKEELVERAIETLAEETGISERIVEEEEKEMIGQIFLLDQTIVREIMVPRIDITAIEKSMSFKDIQDLVTRDGHSRYPVYDESIDRIVGLIYVKDLFNRMPEPGEKFDITKHVREPYFVPETKVIGKLLREFRLKHFHIAVVVDEYGGVAGLVTLEDIIEEIVGEIRDEHDLEEEDFRTLPDGRLLVSAGLLVEELQERLDTQYEQGDYDTVGGLIYDLVGSVPNEGQIVRWHTIEFEVSRVEGQRIINVKVRK